MPPYLVIVWVLFLVLLVAVVAAAIVEAVGRQRLADYLRLDIGDEDERR